MFLSQDEYERIISVFPRVCVDIMLTDTQGRVLLLRRVNQPAQGQWWFPGGRIHIGETRLQAARRKLKEECGLEASVLTEIGSFDLFFQTADATYHDVTILYHQRVEFGQAIVIDDEAEDFGWFHWQDCRNLGVHEYVLNNFLNNSLLQAPPG